MNVTMYYNSSEPEKIGKTLTNTESYECRLKEETSFLEPIILIASGSVPEGNYAYIPFFNRYYFLTDITSVRTGIWQVSLRVDVLESYKTQILAQQVILDRQENLYNLYVEDSELPLKADSFTLNTLPFGTSPFLDAGYILTVQ